MSDGKKDPSDETGRNNPLSADALNALKEAEARRQKAYGEAQNLPEEEGGRGGLEPTRYGDWEKSGIAHDF